MVNPERNISAKPKGGREADIMNSAQPSDGNRVLYVYSRELNVRLHSR